MNTCFSLGKLMKQFGNPPLSKTTLPFQLTPPISEQFFHDSPSLSKFQKQETPLILEGEETMSYDTKS